MFSVNQIANDYFKYMQTKPNYVSAEILLTWQKLLLTCNNPLGLTEEMLEKSKKTAPPLEFDGAEYLGRYLIPRSFVRYD